MSIAVTGATGQLGRLIAEVTGDLSRLTGRPTTPLVTTLKTLV